MDTQIFKQLWQKHYEIVPVQLQKIKQVKGVATGFNANIDAIYKMTGKKLAELIKKVGLSLGDVENIERCRILDEKDFVKGVFKSFSRGIAEEWICENKEVYDWLQKEIGYDKLQIGGQGGIMANVLSSVGVKKVFAHANSLPKLQAEQFAKCDHLLSFDENGNVKPAYQIDRKKDLPLIHWIIEFSRGDTVEVDGKKFKTPKANRFIATYDPLNLKLVLDENFMEKIKKEKLDFVVLSGFHALLAKSGGEALIDKAAERIKEWKQKAPDTLFHLEIASTQDMLIRKAIALKLVPLADSIGINERETIDLLQVLDCKSLAKRCNEQTTAENLLKGISKIKEKTGVKRVQLHMFGLYLTLQDKDFCITPQENFKGMLTAAVVAASKAKTGEVDEKNVKAIPYDVSDVGLIELDSLSVALGQPDLALNGMGRYKSWDLIAVPTILIENPITLVGMGDTISSISLIASR
ncbi:MAG: ADP-dependent glucokinase/phosphofructokinase [Alphaproteobacteria bacterium]|nr:ADP-dependent glucokinase/phosphofructokinase [Alphaproteobacteria bacterium]